MSFGIPGLQFSQGSNVQGSDPNQKPVPTPGTVVRFANIPLINGTGFLPGTTVPIPNDGLGHLFVVSGFVAVTTTEVGGVLSFGGAYAGNATGGQIDAGGHAGPGVFAFTGQAIVVTGFAGGLPMGINQATALTSGAATISGMVMMLQ